MTPGGHSGIRAEIRGLYLSRTQSWRHFGKRNLSSLLQAIQPTWVILKSIARNQNEQDKHNWRRRARW